MSSPQPIPQTYFAPIWCKYLAIVSAAGLLAIWTLPGTIALRHLFLATGLIGGFFVLRQNFSRLGQKTAWPVWLLFLFYGWLLVHLVFFSQEPSIQLSELRSVWARSLIASVIGLSIGLLLQDDKSHSDSFPTAKTVFNERRNLILFLGLSAPTWIIFGGYLNAMVHSGQGMQFDIFQFLYGLYRTKPAYVVFVALSLPLCFILLSRAFAHQESRWWIALSLITIALTPFGGFFIGSKNAMVIFGLSCLIFFINIVFSCIRMPKTSWGSLITLLIITCLGLYGANKHLERTNSWMSMTDNMRIAIDIDHNDFWKNREVFPRPINSSGQPVDISTYERTAWFTAGARLLKENPLGYGLTHHSFGSLALAKWPDFYKPFGNLKGATHSGWLDLALGVGIPGVALIWLCLIATWLHSFKNNGLWFSYAAWTIPLILFTYLIAEVSEGHFLEMLFFVTALFCGLTLPQKINTKNSHG